MAGHKTAIRGIVSGNTITENQMMNAFIGIRYLKTVDHSSQFVRKYSGFRKGGWGELPRKNDRSRD